MTAAPLALYFQTGRLPSNGRQNLLEQARRGNREAFAEMVTPSLPGVYRRARGLTGNAADAEDVSQETLLKAWSRLEQFTASQSGDEFRAWMLRIAANSSIDLLRQRRDGKVLSLEEPRGSTEETIGGGIASERHDPEERCARREIGRLLANAILQLPRDLRQACLLRDVLHYSTEEAATRLGISIVAVRLRLFRAHRRLREQLEDCLRPDFEGAARNEPRGPNRRSTEQIPRRFSSMGAVASYASGD